MTTIRVFIAIHVPRTRQADETRATLESAGARTVPPNQTHLTLSFIGDIDEKKLGKIEECVRKTADAFSPFDIALSGLGAFPNERRPSVVWMGADPAGILKAMAAKLDSLLSAAGIMHDDKPFKAHVTLARCRDGFIAPELFEDNRRTLYCRFECDEILIMKSVLSPKGAEHTVLSRIPLRRRRSKIPNAHGQCFADGHSL